MRALTYDELMLTHGLKWSCAETPLTPDNFNTLIQDTVRCAGLYKPIATTGLPSLLLSAFENSRTSYPDLQQTFRRSYPRDRQDEHTPA
jgi:hypothetical protein